MKKSLTLAIAALLGKISADQILFLDDSEESIGPNAQPTVDPLAWKDTSLPLDERASLLVQAMNLTEKAMMLTLNITNIEGVSDWTGGTAGFERLQVPQINYNDGPQGFRDELHHGSTTAWPSVLAFGQSWDVELVEEWGQKMGSEFKNKGAGVQLGPGMNVMRVGVNGRDFEYVSGEDPIVGATLVEPLVRGIQSNGILANMKHYVNNNQEINRIGQSANIDERTQVEMYMPPFEAAIKAEVGSAMCSYNKVNHEWSCANNSTLNHHLREVMGFEGYVMSDWGAVHSRAPDYLPFGLDQEQQLHSLGPTYFTLDNVIDDVQSGKLPIELVDRSLHRITKQFIKFGLYDNPLPSNYDGDVTSQEHTDFARKGVEESTILLKNKDTSLPLKKEGGKWLLVIGDAASYPVVAGGGSGVVHMKEFVPPIWALADELDIDRENFPLDSVLSFACNKDKSNCIAYLGVIHSTIAFGKVDEKPTMAELSLEDQVNLRSIQQMPFDATLIFAGIYSREEVDRSTLNWRSEVLASLDKFHKKGKVIGALTTPGPALINDLKEACDALILNVMPGQEYGKGLMNVLFGRVNPSAKLSFTMPNIDNEQQMSEAQYPGSDDHWNSSYSEKHHFGYRWYDQNRVKPSFEFGFGLSYTKFQYSQLQVFQNKTILFKLKNIGEMTGSEIVQVYLSVPETDNFKDGYRSPKQLKLFTKVKDIKPQEEYQVELRLDDRAFSYWNVATQTWTVEPGLYKVLVGASSRDIRMSGYITI